METIPWSDRLQDRLAAVESEMRAALLPGAPPAVFPFYGMMDYHLGWRDAELGPVAGRPGKMLRPLLCLLACELNAPWERALPAAAALELLHNFTLVHDDIQDHSPLRRGRPAVWRVWGIAQAINAGDGLFVLARHALLRLRDRGLPAKAVLEAVAVFDRAVLRICEGQYLDLSMEGQLAVDEAAYLEMIDRKTAALLEAALHLGALAAAAGPPQIAPLRAYGRFLGLGFQVQDDFLGVWGEEAHTGKPAAADIHGRKLGLPAVHALAQADLPGREVLARVYGGSAPVSPDDVAAVLQVMARSGTRAYVQSRAAHYLQQALDALDPLPAGPARDDLAAIAAALVGRQG